MKLVPDAVKRLFAKAPPIPLCVCGREECKGGCIVITKEELAPVVPAMIPDASQVFPEAVNQHDASPLNVEAIKLALADFEAKGLKQSGQSATYVALDLKEAGYCSEMGIEQLCRGVQKVLFENDA